MKILPTRRSLAATYTSPCSFGLSDTSQQYFSLRTNQPSPTSQQYISLRTNQHQSSATSRTNWGSRGYYASWSCLGQWVGMRQIWAKAAAHVNRSSCKDSRTVSSWRRRHPRCRRRSIPEAGKRAYQTKSHIQTPGLTYLLTSNIDRNDVFYVTHKNIGWILYEFNAIHNNPCSEILANSHANIPDWYQWSCLQENQAQTKSKFSLTQRYQHTTQKTALTPRKG
jgi:hypothetical protein